MRESAADKAVRVLRAGCGVKAGTEEIGAAIKTLRKLPPGVPVDVVREAWRWTMRFPLLFYTLKNAPDERFELDVAGLESWQSPAATFLLAVVAADRRPAALQAANRAFWELDNLPSPYSPSGRKRIEAVIRLEERYEEHLAPRNRSRHLRLWRSRRRRLLLFQGTHLRRRPRLSGGAAIAARAVKEVCRVRGPLFQVRQIARAREALEAVRAGG